MDAAKIKHDLVLFYKNTLPAGVSIRLAKHLKMGLDSIGVHTHRKNGILGKRADAFQAYIKRNPGYARELERMTAGMDGASVLSARTMLEKYIYISRHERLKERFWCDENLEKELPGIIRSLKGFSRKARVPKYMYLWAEDTFYFNSGLSFVPQGIRKSCLKGRDVLDCGAYHGDSALAFSRIRGVRKVFSFEPVSSNFRLLKDTIAFCDLGNVLPFRLGVGERKAVARMDDRGVSSRIDDAAPEGEKVEVTDIDSFVREHKASLGVVKLDVEGYELKAVKGAMKSIARDRPILLISIYHTPEDFFGIKPYLEKRLRGYRYLIRHLVYYHPVYETVLIAYPERGIRHGKRRKSSW